MTKLTTINKFLTYFSMNNHQMNNYKYSKQKGKNNHISTNPANKFVVFFMQNIPALYWITWLFFCIRLIFVSSPNRQIKYKEIMKKFHETIWSRNGFSKACLHLSKIFSMHIPTHRHRHYKQIFFLLSQ